MYINIIINPSPPSLLTSIAIYCTEGKGWTYDLTQERFRRPGEYFSSSEEATKAALKYFIDNYDILMERKS